MYKIAFLYNISADICVKGEWSCEDEQALASAMASLMTEFLCYGIPGTLSMAVASVKM